MKTFFSKKGYTKAVYILIAAVILLVLPFIFKSYFQHHIMIMILIWAIAGMGWNIIGGYAGQVSNGHALFYALGAYSCAIGMRDFNLTPWVSMWIGVLIAALVAWAVGTPLLRLKGHYFAVATMAVSECARYIFQNWDAIGGATGIDFLNRKSNEWYTMQFRNKIFYYYIILAFCIGVLCLVVYLSKSRFGYYLRCIKGNDMAAESVGIDTSRYKMYAYVISACIVSLAGSLYAQYMCYIDPSMLMTLNTSLMMVLVAVMGGAGTIVGPMIGASILVVISENTRALFGGNGFNLFLYGVLVILFVLFLPNGVLSVWPKMCNAVKKCVKKSPSGEEG